METEKGDWGFKVSFYILYAICKTIPFRHSNRLSSSCLQWFVCFGFNLFDKHKLMAANKLSNRGLRHNNGGEIMKHPF
jgi:hypothetical protein